MNNHFRLKLVLVGIVFSAAFSIILMPGCKKQQAQNISSSSRSGISSDDWIVPVNADNGTNASQIDYYNFAWQTFIAINWPNDNSYRGKPDTSKSIGASDSYGNLMPVVWETWQEQYQIFLPGAINPGPWNQPDEGCGGGVLGKKRLMMLSKSNGAEIFDEFNEATGQPLIDQDSQFVRFEVRACESEYMYIVNNSYYNADSQIAAVAAGNFQGFPNGTDPLSRSLQAWAQFGATEVKASWRVFTNSTTAAEKERYYRTTAILTDTYGNCVDTVEIGLIGLHILRLTPTTGSSWYWASFEQVDNLTLQSQYGGTLPAHPTFNTNPPVEYGDSGYSYKPAQVDSGKPLPPPIPVGVSSPPFLRTTSELDSINMLYSQMLANTPFQYYQLIGTVNPPSPGQEAVTDSASGYPSVNVNTAWLANSTMETYSNNSNCVTCHIFGFPQMPPRQPKTSSLQVFTFLLGLAQKSK